MVLVEFSRLRLIAKSAVCEPFLAQQSLPFDSTVLEPELYSAGRGDTLKPMSHYQISFIHQDDEF